MRCQKVRSCLSAYCNQELTEDRTLAVRAHLAGCSSCRAAERSWLSLRDASKQMPMTTVSQDFNTRLLNRLAEEKFAETRQRVPQPSSLGWLRFRQLIPALAGVAAVSLLAATGMMQRGIALVPELLAGTNGSEQGQAAVAGLDNSYLTVQPGSAQQHRLGAPLHADQTLAHSLAFSDRVSRLSRGLSPQSGFGMQLASDVNSAGQWNDPFARYYFQPGVLPGAVSIRRSGTFGGSSIRIYFMPAPDSQRNSREDAARY